MDVRSRRIPNKLTVPGMAVALLLHFLSGGWRELGGSAMALLLCGAAFLVIYMAGGMGAGDVKLIAAEGSFLGLSAAVPLLAFTVVCGGLFAVVMMVRHGQVRQTTGNVAVLVSHHVRKGITPHPELNVSNERTLRLPYALAIAAGTLLTMLLRAGGTV